MKRSLQEYIKNFKTDEPKSLPQEATCERWEHEVSLSAEDCKMLVEIYDIVLCSSRILEFDKKTIDDFRRWLDKIEAWPRQYFLFST